MIVYGTNGVHLRTAPLPGVPCPVCAAPDTLHLSLFSRYAHVYGVPLFPYSKPAVARCALCQSAWNQQALPTELRPAVRRLKQEVRAPFWHWTGLLLLAAGLAWSAVAGGRDDRANAAYLAAPRAGDVYTVRATTPDGQANYSLLKVVSARGNGVELVANEYQVNDAHPYAQLNAPFRYGKKPFTLTQFELQIMKNKGQLTDVDRPGE